MRGKLIVLEGLDRAGKSTQCKLLASHLEVRGLAVRHLRFPDRTTPIGKMIDSYLKGDAQQEDHVIHLLFSANRWEAAKSIEEDIADGKIVVVDRYYSSGCVYSAAKQNPNLDLSWARHPEVGLPRPDVCIFLDISAVDAAKRSDFGTERYENKEMQDRVRDLFQVIRSSQEKDDFVTIDAGATLDAVQAQILDVALRTIQEVDKSGLPLRHVQPW